MQIDQNKLRLSLKKIVILTLETLKKEEKKKETTIHVIKIVGIFLDSHFQLHDILSRFRSSSSTFLQTELIIRQMQFARKTIIVNLLLCTLITR